MTARRPDSLAGLPLLEDLGDLDGRWLLVRVDFNVPLHTEADGTVTVADDFRMRAALPTLEYLLARGARVTAISHLGRPDGAPDPRWEMGPLRRRLDQLCPGIELGENLRFFPGEKADDPAFVAQLVAGHDGYVNEAYGVCHRAHASLVGPPATLPSAAGRRLAREVAVMGGLLDDPVRPFVAVVGGAKVADKMGVLQALAPKVDRLVVGGAMAFTFLAAMGHEVGASLVDLSRVEDCRRLLHAETEIVLPTDVIALEPGGLFCPDGQPDGPRGDTKILGRDLPDGWTGYDIGPESSERFAQAVAGAGTVLWNGPLGAFEDERFAAGTRRMAEAVAHCPGFTVVGGGDSANALDHLGLAEQIDFLSTGGGASLELIEHGDLPALAALRRAPNAPAAEPAEPAAMSPRPRSRSPRRPLVSGNWKLHHDHIEALHAVRDLGLRLKPEDRADLDVSVHPPFTDLRTVQTLIEGEHLALALGAQHCSEHDHGPFTGEVAPQMLARLGVRYVVVGHSERRQLFAMADATVAATLRAVVRHQMVPICCVGETGQERDAGHTERRLREQVHAAFDGLDPAAVTTAVVAYEPIWAIGTGRAATAVDAQDACSFIRELVAGISGPEAAGGLRIQYGGSVNAENAAELVAEPDVDGLLVGGASLEAAKFVDVIRAVAGCYRS